MKRNVIISFVILLAGFFLLYYTSTLLNIYIYEDKDITLNDKLNGMLIGVLIYIVVGAIWFVIYLFVVDITYKKEPVKVDSRPVTPDLERVLSITNNITMSVFGVNFFLYVAHDKVYENGRIYLQVKYVAPCTKTGEVQEWNGRKWYLSEFMTEDEIVKTAWCAFEGAVKHELMEGFKFNNIIVFNPHVNFRALLEVSNQEIKRD